MCALFKVSRRDPNVGVWLFNKVGEHDHPALLKSVGLDLSVGHLFHLRCHLSSSLGFVGAPDAQAPLKLLACGDCDRVLSYLAADFPAFDGSLALLARQHCFLTSHVLCVQFLGCDLGIRVTNSSLLSL